jgi:hypothetical protein
MTDDRWIKEEFEDEIANMIETCYIKPVKRSVSNMKVRASRVTPGIMRGIRETIPHMPGKDRLVLPHQYGFDLTNDPLPETRTCIFCVPTDERKSPHACYLRRINGHVSASDLRALGVKAMPADMPQYRATWVSQDWKHPRGLLIGMTVWCWIDAAGQVRLSNSPGIDWSITRDREAVLEMICTALQAHADRRFCWEITADEGTGGGKASIGCTAEEVKSLLYARELPVTATGRKRPILHLVASHRRRMKEGHEIDIEPFMRGVREVVMDGTRFSVRGPVA